MAKDTQRIILLRTNDVTKAIDWIEQGKGIAEIPFCGNQECAANIEKRTESLRFLGEPEQYIEVLNEQVTEESELFCVECQSPVKHYWRISRAY